MIADTLQFWLNTPGIPRQELHPIYSDGLSIRWSKHEGDEFYLPDWSEELIFTHDEADLIASFSLGKELILDVGDYQEGNLTEFIKLKFRRVDGAENRVEHTFKVTPKPITYYDMILAKLNEEYDLFQLDHSPVIERVMMHTRPILQLYILGGNTIGNWMGALHWETPIENWEDLVFNEIEVIGSVPDPNNVISTTLYGFLYDQYLSRNVFSVTAMGDDPINPNPIAYGRKGTYVANDCTTNDLSGTYDMDNGFVMEISYSNGNYFFRIKRNGTEYWRGNINTSGLGEDFSLVLSAVGGSTPSSMRVAVHKVKVATRLIANTHPITDGGGRTWGTIQAGQSGTGSRWGYLKSYVPYIDGRNDVVVNSDPFIDTSNYKYYIQYAPPVAFMKITGNKTTQPNSFGLWEPNIYYMPEPYYKPFAPTSWGDWAVWYERDGLDSGIDNNGSVVMTLRHAYPLWSVLEVLLQAVDPSIRFDREDFSQFFGPASEPSYLDPLVREQMNVFLTPSSNILVGNYDQPAQKAKIKLGQLLDALKKIYLVYWYIDSSGTFRLEHKSFFENGGSYSGSPVIGLDLTRYQEVLVDKPWSFVQDEWSAETDNLFSEITYEWPENTSDPFTGRPIKMLADFVDPKLKDERSIEVFVPDVDLMRAAPGDFSKDGFAIMNFNWLEKLGYILTLYQLEDRCDGTRYRLQNYRMAGIFLNVNYRCYSLPCQSIRSECSVYSALSLARDKIQTARWPATAAQFQDTENQLMKLIKTSVGNGSIQEISVFLCSRKVEAKLRFTLE